MIHTLKGIVTEKRFGFFVFEVSGIGFKVYTNTETLKHIIQGGSEMRIYCFLHTSENQIDLFGFLDEPTLSFFGLLNTVPGVGPRTALNVLDVDSVQNITAAILEKRVDLLTRASGIGKKTAERIVIELQNKLHIHAPSTITKSIDMEIELEEALVGLGYQKKEAKQAIRESSTDGVFEDRLRAALKNIGKTK
jgi:Holliday junction DNA helicase RuvA